MALKLEKYEVELQLAAWSFAILCGFLATNRQLLGVPTKGLNSLVPSMIFSAVVCVVLRKRPTCFDTALLGNLCGIMFGVGVGIGAIAMVFSDANATKNAIKWTVLSLILLIWFLWNLVLDESRNRENIDEPLPKTPEEFLDWLDRKIINFEKEVPKERSSPIFILGVVVMAVVFIFCGIEAFSLMNAGKSREAMILIINVGVALLALVLFFKIAPKLVAKSHEKHRALLLKSYQDLRKSLQKDIEAETRKSDF